jgi:DNA-binding IclR family transcriptional regulator
MKEYRLSAWPDLDASYERMAYRRMLSDMSQRHVTLGHLCKRSGLARQEVSDFLGMLVGRGIAMEREADHVLLLSRISFGAWLRRTVSGKSAPARRA